MLWGLALMRSVTQPLFPASVGAVTLQDVLDAREGDRLPLDLALYVSGEVGKQVTQLQAQGREGALDPKRVWCTHKGAVVVHEASGGKADPHALSDLVYRLLSGSGEVSAWPPSYFNPSVAESIDAAVMKAIAEEGPEVRSALLDAVTSAATSVDPEVAVDGMARLVYAVSPDEPKKAYAPKRSSTVSDLFVPQVAAPWFTPRRAGLAAGLALALLLVVTVLAFSGGKPAPAAAAAVPAPTQPALTQAEIRFRTVEAIRAAKKPAKAAAATKKAIAKRK